MVQTGNEINHGMLWPDGNIQHPDSLAHLDLSRDSCCERCRSHRLSCCILHWVGKMSESEFFLDNMINRGVTFDVIGESYYPKWHGTLQDLQSNLAALKEI